MLLSQILFYYLIVALKLRGELSEIIRLTRHELLRTNNRTLRESRRPSENSLPENTTQIIGCFLQISLAIFLPSWLRPWDPSYPSTRELTRLVAQGKKPDFSALPPPEA
ncbi:hypothetical protein TNIN_62341 [Trichonephila inaurata madagascariensis]|uniref:Uncharacterized protein n=1 Tax=Trichonephila inaurata madagascariensis TaxID=2747483 RepID=A0A8X7CKW0_9ARAC|nr:hypothetical protein TNIN_62341 [Trichonephila inaurata madagascariensis]